MTFDHPVNMCTVHARYRLQGLDPRSFEDVYKPKSACQSEVNTLSRETLI